MSDIAKIKIAKVGRKEMPSKFKEGETYNITNVLDELTGRKGAAMGAWADTWKVGDTIEGIWKERTYKDKDGFEQKSWNVENPNKKDFKSGGYGPRKPSIVDAYQIAAALAPVLFKDKKIKFEDINRLADEVMKKLSAATPATPDATKAEGNDVDLSKEEATPKKKVAKADDFEVDEGTKTTDEATEEEDDDDLF